MVPTQDNVDNIGNLSSCPCATQESVIITNVFHVSLLKKYVKDVDHVIEWSVFQVEPKGELHMEHQCILQRKMSMLQNRAIEQAKVQWKHFGPDEATWEMEYHMQIMCPYLFVG